ncbi:MAG: RluA family pseudouridine synthase [Bacteroidales bacterium]|nr:RluA family pseudouridine synthase [Bacteroidales bacterium]
MLPEKFTYPFCYVPHPLIREAAAALIERIDASDYLRGLFGEGKMMGALLVEDAAGDTRVLYGFSGVAGGTALVEGFVPPIFDLTEPGGYYRTAEARITAINERLALLRTEMSVGKCHKAGGAESTFQQTSLSSDSTHEAGGAESAEALERERHALSVELQDWIFSRYRVSNARGESLSIKEVFARRGLVPPGGTGDCAAPKLLQYAYSHGLKPLAMGEFWYGASPRREVRTQGRFYPSCTGKCGPLLEFMLQGLDVEPNPLAQLSTREPRIVFQDQYIIVAEKPSGMLAAPGRYVSHSMVSALEKLTGAEVFSCHRLDMDTSGLMVFAKTAAVQAALHRQFAAGEVRKRYQARLQPGRELPAEQGEISIPLSLDYYDRPRQMADWESGKPALTRYRVLRHRRDGSTDIEFEPLTGRTHQLRVHAAHALGLGRPIAGDRLYGGDPATPDAPLALHASRLEFRHPVTGEPLLFQSPLK